MSGDETVFSHKNYKTPKRLKSKVERKGIVNILTFLWRLYYEGEKNNNSFFRDMFTCL